MDSENDEFIQENFPHAEKENMFRSKAIEDKDTRIVGFYHR